MEKRHSIKLKITLLLVSITTGIILLILFLNSTFSEKYYQSDKVDSMLTAYNDVASVFQEYKEGTITEQTMNNRIEKGISAMGMEIVIVDSAWSPCYPSNTNKNSDEIIKRFQMSLFESAGTVIDEEENYAIVKVYDSRMNDYYLQIYGNIYDGTYYLMMRLPLQSIKDSVTIANRFIQYVGIGVILLSLVIVYFFAGYFTKPIKELSNIAERMSELDFNAKYQGKDRSEIGLLGNSMNRMSEKLERNISQLKAANIELKKDIENKIQIDEMRQDFLSNVSHELKTPIALIQGYAEGLKEGISDDPESMDFYCDVIMDEANKMNAMVKKLLTLNQIEFGNEELVMERFDVVELISSIVHANEIRASQKDITIHFDNTEPVYVWSDEYKIEEVITNYLSNAINHCDFEKKITISLQNYEDVVRVSVFNTGKNIPDEDIDNIWIKFYKVDKARTREYGGNGIGLSIVKAILDSYDKQCGAINHENGVEFWFELDCKKD